ncbi:MAG: hypothetical protein ABIT71_10625 [Vicinamibacteraceae bacterium]
MIGRHEGAIESRAAQLFELGVDRAVALGFGEHDVLLSRQLRELGVGGAVVLLERRPEGLHIGVLALRLGELADRDLGEAASGLEVRRRAPN